MKYIVTKQKDGTKEIFIFSDSIHHDCMAELLCHIKDQTDGQWKRIYREPISAGFIKDGKCVGESETLSLVSDPTDTLLIK